MRLFGWWAVGPVPAAFDLRRLGWRLTDAPPAFGESFAYPLLVSPIDLSLSEWLRLAGAAPDARRWMMLVGVNSAAERARLLRLGFGEVAGAGLELVELEARTIRMIENARALPRYRQIGALRLDLLGREAFVAGRALGLHPREFALIWRLADTPGEGVSPSELLGDVWRLNFRPETNSLAVHVSRLRTKLRLAGLDGLIATCVDGGYRLAIEFEARQIQVHKPGVDLELDAYLRLGEECGQEHREQEDDHAA